MKWGKEGVVFKKLHLWKKKSTTTKKVVNQVVLHTLFFKHSKVNLLIGKKVNMNIDTGHSVMRKNPFDQ